MSDGLDHRRRKLRLIDECNWDKHDLRLSWHGIGSPHRLGGLRAPSSGSQIDLRTETSGYTGSGISIDDAEHGALLAIQTLAAGKIHANQRDLPHGIVPRDIGELLAHHPVGPHGFHAAIAKRY